MTRTEENNELVLANLYIGRKPSGTHFSRKLWLFFISLFQLGFVALLWFYLAKSTACWKPPSSNLTSCKACKTTMNRALQAVVALWFVSLAFIAFMVWYLRF